MSYHVRKRAIARAQDAAFKRAVTLEEKIHALGGVWWEAAKDGSGDMIQRVGPNIGARVKMTGTAEAAVIVPGTKVDRLTAEIRKRYGV